MKNPYKTAKQIGRKYLAPAVATTALILGNGCDSSSEKYSLPLEESIKSELMKREQDTSRELFKEYINKARTGFNRSIEDNFLDEEEQKEIYGNFESAYEVTQNHPQYVAMSEGDNLLYNLLDENLNGWDSGKPNLEKQLRSEDLDVEVESIYSGREAIPADISVMILSIIAFFGIAYLGGTALANASYVNEDEKYR